MTEKTIHFISGTPRSGSTLLANLLAQNPKFHCTATSGIAEILVMARNRFSQVSSFMAMREDDLELKKLNVFKGILFGYFADVEKPVCFEKSRGTEGFLEMYERILGRRPKLLCCVRDVREILASFEKLYWKTSATRQIPDEPAAFWQYQTIVGRCNRLLANEGGIVAREINRIVDASRRGWKFTEDGDRAADIYCIDYEQLTCKPKKTLSNIYEFLAEDEFKHDFDNVQQVTYEDDLVHVYKDLHKIRPKVAPQETTWTKILPKEYAESIVRDAKIEPHFWKGLK